MISLLLLVGLTLLRVKKPVLEEKPKGTEMGEVGLIAEGKGVRQWKL